MLRRLNGQIGYPIDFFKVKIGSHNIEDMANEKFLNKLLVMSLRFLSSVSDNSHRAAEEVFWPQGTVHELCNLGMWSKKAEREVLKCETTL